MTSIKYTIPMDYQKKTLSSLEPFTCAQEKDALLLDNESTPAEFAKKLSNVTPRSEEEALLFLLKLREISVSDVVDMTVECPSCKMMNSLQIEISDFYGEAKEEKNVPVCLLPLDKITTQEVYDDIPLGDIMEIDEILTKYREEILTMNAKKKCMRCGKDIGVFIDPRQSISKVDLLGLYREYFELAVHLHYGKNDVDSMLPFERKIFIDMMKKASQAT